MTAIILAGGKSSRMGYNKAFLKIKDEAFIECQIRLLREIFDNILISANSPSRYKYLDVPVIEDIYPDKGPLGGIYTGIIKSSSFYTFILACDMPFIKIDTIRYLAGFTGQRTEDRGQNTEDRRQRIEDRREKLEERGQKILTPTLTPTLTQKTEERVGADLSVCPNKKRQGIEKSGEWKGMKGEVADYYDVIVPVIGNRMEPLHAFYSKRCIEPIKSALDQNVLKISSFFPKVNVKKIGLDNLDSAEDDNIYKDSLINVNTMEEYEGIKGMIPL